MHLHLATSKVPHFFSSCPFLCSFLSLIETNKRMLFVSAIETALRCAHVNRNRLWGSILSAVQYRCVGSSHLVPQMEQKSKCACAQMCVSVAEGCGPKLKLGFEAEGPVVETPSRDHRLSGESGKTSQQSSIKTLVTQMTRNNSAFSIHVIVSPPPGCHVPPTCTAAP